MKHPDIRVTIKKDEDNALILLKDLQAIAKSENVLYQAYDNFRISLSQKVAPTENLEAMRSIFDGTSSALKEIIEAQKLYIQLIETKIAPSIQAYGLEVKELKASLEDSEKKHKLEEQKKLEYNKVSNQAQNKKEPLKREHTEAKRKANMAAVNLATKLRLYVTNRNIEFKAIVQHMVNKQMQYHAKALSELSKLANNINKQKEEEESTQLLEVLIGNKLGSEVEDTQKD